MGEVSVTDGVLGSVVELDVGAESIVTREELLAM